MLPPYSFCAVDGSRSLIEIARVKHVVAQELVEISVKIIGARSNREAFHPAAAVPKLRGVTARGDGQLLKGIRRQWSCTLGSPPTSAIVMLRPSS